MGSVQFSGQKYQDSMCFIQSREARSMETGKYCVENFDFIASKEVIGNFEANGIIGLAPVNDGRSIVRALKKSKQMESTIIGLNFEDPLDTSQRS